MNLHFEIRKNGSRVLGILDDGNTFNPLTVIGDLIHYTRNSNIWDYQIEKTFQQIFKVECDVDIADYFDKMCVLRNLIQTDRLFHKNNFSLIMSFFNLEFEYNIERFAKNAEISQCTKTPLKYNKCPIEDIFRRTDYEKYKYHCKHMADVPFAILHFLLLNDYKMKRCKHCGKYFATLNSKDKYCMRKSSMEGYEHLECRNVVDLVMSTVRPKKKTIYRNLYSNHSQDRLYIFCDTYDAFDNNICDKRPEDLMVLKYITDNNNRKKLWYSSKKRTKKNKRVGEQQDILLTSILNGEKNSEEQRKRVEQYMRYHIQKDSTDDSPDIKHQKEIIAETLNRQLERVKRHRYESNS